MDSDYSSVVLTHGGCADGTTAAHMFELFPNLEEIGKIKIYYVFERDFDKNKNMPSLVGKRVFIVDYSFPIPVLLRIASVASHLYIFDHHVTALKDLFGDTKVMFITTAITITYDEDNKPYVANGEYSSMQKTLLQGISTIEKNTKVVHSCKIEITFDLTKCGAEVTWDALNAMSMRDYAKSSQPWYLVHVRDRDLWLWDKPGYVAGVHYDPNSKAFGEAFYDMQINCETLKKLDTYSITEREKMYARGRELMEHNARFASSAAFKAERVTFEGYPALVSVCSILQSEIGNTLVNTIIPDKKNPENPPYVPEIGIVLRYNIAERYWMVSLRGRTGSPNLADLAKKYGGGGHPLAAGFDYSGNIYEIFIA